MRNAKRPSGPAKPTHATREAVTLREEIDEMNAGTGGADDSAEASEAAVEASVGDPMRNARHAERDGKK